MQSQQIWNDIDWALVAQRVVFAVLILIVTWALARLVVWAFAKLAEHLTILRHAGADGATIGSTLGRIASLLIWMFGLIAILQVFNLGEVLAPIQELLNGVMNFLPNIIGAVFIFVLGSLFAKIARQLVETALGAIPFQKWFGRAGGEEATGNDNIVRTIGLVLYALIMIVVAIASLQVLGISSISDPAQAMLATIFNAIPNIIAAAVMLALGVVIAGFGANVLGQLIDGLGADKALRELGVLKEGQSSIPTITVVIKVAIILFFSVMAAQLLGFPAVTAFISGVLVLGAKVLFGGAIIAVGFFLGNLVARLFSGTAATVVRYATIILFAAMGLTAMGIADSIIVLAFGSLVVGAAAAAALAFGLGGRDAAARMLAKAERSGDLPS